MSRVFLIPGMGADSRIYAHIEIPVITLPGDSSPLEKVPVDWIEPDKADTLTTYATKLIQHYGMKDGDLIIGNSLGGMIAVEIANQLKLKKVVLISSIKTIDEAPWYFKLFRILPLYKVIPGAWLIKGSRLIRPLFGEMYPNHARLFYDMLRDTSPRFLTWSMGAALHWKNKTIPPHLYHITGNKDLVFNYRRIKNVTLVEGGVHSMIFYATTEINQWLAAVLAE